jgi:uncharacterized protein
MIHHVRDIIIYPIKGLAGIPLQEAKALPMGFENDRRWMLIDENNQFITQRTQPRMALFQQEVSDGLLSVTYNNSSFSFSMSEVSETLIQTKVWDDIATTQVVSHLANDWFSHQLGQKVRLVKIANDNARMHYSTIKDINFPVSLADGYPYLIVGEASLQLLNEKMSEKVQMNRFRPNIVVSSSVAHEEDEWGDFKVGSATFTNIKPCGRCIVITIEQTTGKINNETLKILNTYRKKDNSVLFGTNVVCNVPGKVSVGDKIEF